MLQSMPTSAEAIIIAGANGAGKTTFARQVLPVCYPSATFLNADEIRLERPLFSHPVAAGRDLIRRLEAAVCQRLSFVVEPTLSSRGYSDKLRNWTALGFQTTLHFIELPSPEFAVRRVAERVAAGGHGVPEADVRRRFERGLRLFSSVYKPLVDRWYHWRSDDLGLRLDGCGDGR